MRNRRPFVARPRPTDARRRLRLVLAAVLGLLVATAAVISACTKEPERSVAEFCTHARPVIGFDVVIASGDTANINRTVADLRALEQVAPGDIVTQVGILVTITNELGIAIADGKDPDLAAKEVFKNRQADIAKIDDAGRAVEAYASEHCHFSVVGTIPPGTVPGTRPGSVPGSITTTKATTSTTTGGRASTTTPAKTSTTARTATTKKP